MWQRQCQHIPNVYCHNSHWWWVNHCLSQQDSPFSSSLNVWVSLFLPPEMTDLKLQPLQCLKIECTIEIYIPGSFEMFVCLQATLYHTIRRPLDSMASAGVRTLGKCKTYFSILIWYKWTVIVFISVFLFSLLWVAKKDTHITIFSGNKESMN